MGLSIRFNDMVKDYKNTPSTNTITPTNPPDLSNPYSEGSYGAHLWDSNPYRNTVATQTFWDKVANAFGVRSGFDKIEQDRIQHMNEYDSQIEQLMQENKYNSPIEQQQRMLQAGINPQSNSPDNAEGSGFDMPQSPLPSSDIYHSDLRESASNLFNFLLGGLNGGISLGNFVQSKLSNELQREGINIQNESSLIGLANDLSGVMPSAEEIFKDNVIPDLEANSGLGKTRYQRPYDNYAQWVIYHADDAVRDLHISKMDKDKVRDRIVKSMMSPDKVSKFIDESGNLRSSRSAYKVSSRDPFLVDSKYEFINQSSKVANEYIDKVNKIGMELGSLELEYKKSQAEFNKAYWSNRNGKNQADMEEARIEADKFVRQSQKAMAEAFSEITSWLYGVSKNPHSNVFERNFARGTLASLYATQNHLMPSLPSFSFDNSSSNEWNRFGGEKYKSSFKFKLGR